MERSVDALTWAALGSGYQVTSSSASEEQFIFLVQPNFLQNLHAIFILKFCTIGISIRPKFLRILESPEYASLNREPIITALTWEGTLVCMCIPGSTDRWLWRLYHLGDVK